jgi:hypothetical protein
VCVTLGWRKRGRAGAMLAALAPVIGGEVCDGRSLTKASLGTDAPLGTKLGVRGTYQGYLVAAWPKRQYPGPPVTGDPHRNPPQVNIFEIALVGVSGRQLWQCQSWPSANPLAAPSFKFGGGEWLTGKLAALGAMGSLPVADAALKERLVAAGLFDELSLLRGSHRRSGFYGASAEAAAYLPKVRYTPSGRAMAQAQFARMQGAINERLSAQGHPELEPLLEERFRASWAEDPGGRLHCEVELSDEPVPAVERFRELLDHLLRLAQINVEANPPEVGGRT